MFADFHFIRPDWLWALIPVVILLLLLLWFYKQQSPWHQLIAPHLQKVLLGGPQQTNKLSFALPLLLLSWVIAVLALAGPSWQKLPQPAFALKRATVLVLDMSMSMRATDMTPDRLTQLRFKALDFAQQLPEGELALLSFAGDAFVISPLTPDHNNIRLLIPDLRPEIMPVQGSNLLAALQQANQLLLQAGYPRGDVVVFTDGFDNGSYNNITDLINNWPHRLSVLAFGSEQGAPVRLDNGELLKNNQGAVVVPRVPLQQLSQLTRRSQGVFTTATIGDQDLQRILDLSPLSELNQQNELQQIKGDQWQDSAVYLVWLLLPLVLLSARKAPVILLAAISILPPTPAEAASWQDLWQTRTQQAQEHYRQQQYDDAQQKFTDPLWQGNAAYRNGDYQSAELAFQQAASATDDATAFHNLGNALAQQHRYAEAQQAYNEALARQPDLTRAQQNAELMEKLLQQQQSDDSQQQGDDEQGQDNNSSENQQNKQQSSDPQSQQQNDQGNNEDGTADKQDPADSAPEQTAEQPDTEQPAESAAEPAEPVETEPEPPQARQQPVHETWPNATPEQQQELDNLLRKVQDDPSLLLRNKMYLEYQKRRQQSLPRGVEQEW
ncbi:VWA domain-containing protein [Chromatiaceae bacterium AAb-1]|nr:VWA domain-containing protein [Chromatiaceae bacterium AAb-1]